MTRLVPLIKKLAIIIVTSRFNMKMKKVVIVILILIVILY